MPFDLQATPKAGYRITLPDLHGSADSYALCQSAMALKLQQRMLTVFVADATDAQRLQAEISWFANSSSYYHVG